jgi:hypothetical protein
MEIGDGAIRGWLEHNQPRPDHVEQGQPKNAPD